MLASLRERIVGELMSQPIASGQAAIEIASAHLYEQARREAFNRLAAHDALMVDAEPERLGIELVNRYHAVKRAGLI
jgi:GAF domain-containing protein